MKPLNEWTDAELREELCNYDSLVGDQFKAAQLDELLRRNGEAMRARCLAAAVRACEEAVAGGRYPDAEVALAAVRGVQ